MEERVVDRMGRLKRYRWYGWMVDRDLGCYW